jgi:hypothetical protein
MQNKRQCYWSYIQTTDRIVIGTCTIDQYLEVGVVADRALAQHQARS